jgi:hypothetical protein
MRYHLFVVLALGGVVLTVRGAEEDQADRAKALAEVKKWGGKVELDEQAAGKPVVGVNLGGTRIKDAGVATLKGLPNLQRLNLARTDLTDESLPHLKVLGQLQLLDLTGTSVSSKGLEPLQGLTKMQTLNLSSTQVNDQGLSYLKGMKDLRTLNLGLTEVSDKGLETLKGLTKLQHLNLNSTQVTNYGLKHLKGLKDLQTLSVSVTEVTDDGVKELQKALPKLKVTR